MRLVSTLNNEAHARKFTTYLAAHNIDARCEASVSSDWGSDTYGDVSFSVWVFDEDDYLIAKQHWMDFEEAPDDPRFNKAPPTKAPKATGDDRSERDGEASEQGRGRWRDKEAWKEGARQLAQQPRELQKKKTSVITFYLIAVCTAVFLWTQFHSNFPKEVPDYLPPTSIVYPKLQKQLLFDYPDAYVTADKLILLYGLDKLMDPQSLPDEGKVLLNKYTSTPHWEGAYPLVVDALKNGDDAASAPPWFERINGGEIWRLFTPALLHGDIFHLVFNMIWLAILGTQIEGRIGKFRYLLFILLTAIPANVAQYLMSGFNFLGFSGVVCGMITFIWMRKRRAPWEGYLLQRSTIGFISFFVLAMLGLQIASFVLEATTDFALSAQVANTAHIVGGLTGVALGGSRFGRWTN